MLKVIEPDTGHLATLNHQRAIKRLIVGLDKLYDQGNIRLEALPETDIDPGNPEKTWLKYIKGKGESTENTSWSEVLKVDLGGLV